MDGITKLEQEIKNPGKLSRIEAAMLEPVGKMLISFCRQDARFASAVFEKKETLSECMHEVSKGVTYAISDVEAYKRAVTFYFPAAEVDFKCVIVLPAEKKGVVTRGIGGVGAVALSADEDGDEIKVSLLDLF